MCKINHFVISHSDYIMMLVLIITVVYILGGRKCKINHFALVILII